MVAEHEVFVRALETRLEVADVVEERRPAELAEYRAHRRLGSGLFVDELAVGVAGVGPARQAVPARQVDAGLIAERHPRRPVRVDHRAHVEDADAGAVKERRAGVGELVHDEAGEHFGVGDEDHGGDRRRRRRARRGRRREDRRQLELAAGDQLVETGFVELKGRRRHRQTGEAAGRAAGRRHLGHDAQRRPAEGARDHDRLARAGQHGGELDEVDALGVDVLGQSHRHHEVDVGELLAEGRVGFDVGQARPAAALPRVGDVEAVGTRAIPGAAVGELAVEAAVGRPTLEQPRTRRARQSPLDELARQAGAGVADTRARLPQQLERLGVADLDAGLGEQFAGRLVDPAAGRVVPDAQLGPRGAARRRGRRARRRSARWRRRGRGVGHASRSRPAARMISPMRACAAGSSVKARSPRSSATRALTRSSIVGRPAASHLS